MLVFGFCLTKHRDIRVSVFACTEEISVGFAAFLRSALHSISSRETEFRQGRTFGPSAITDELLKLISGFGMLSCCQVSQPTMIQHLGFALLVLRDWRKQIHCLECVSSPALDDGPNERQVELLIYRVFRTEAIQLNICAGGTLTRIEIPQDQTD